MTVFVAGVPNSHDQRQVRGTAVAQPVVEQVEPPGWCKTPRSEAVKKHG